MKNRSTLTSPRPERILRAGLLFLFLSILGVVSCSMLQPNRKSSGPDGTTVSLNVMTFNIRYGTAADGPNHWQNRKPLVFRVIQKYDPDVVGLQEALDFQIREILAADPRYGFSGAGRDDGRTLGEHAAILFKQKKYDKLEEGTFWFSDTPDVPGSFHWGNRLPRICSWVRLRDKKTGCAWTVYNVHLDHLSQPSREKSAVALSERIVKNHDWPAVVTGDFNAGPKNPALLYLKGQGTLRNQAGAASSNPFPLTDTFAVLHPDTNGIATFGNYIGNRKGDKIDFILIGPGLRARRSEIVRAQWNGKYPSDHYPVTARVDIPCSMHFSSKKPVQDGAQTGSGSRRRIPSASITAMTRLMR